MKAGLFECDITPPGRIYLAGYPHRNEPSKGVADPLFLRMLALEDRAGERVVLVTSDLLKFPRDMSWRTKKWCEETFGLKSSALVLNTSHTHCAPGLFHQECYPQWPVDAGYVRRLESLIREGIESALKDLRPARITFGIQQAHFGVSRRLPDPELGGKVRMAPNEKGYYDPDLPVMAVYDAGCATPKAILYSYACHPTSRSGFEVSADYPGDISRGLKKALGNGVMTLFAQGAGASIMPRKLDGAWDGIAADIASFATSEKMQELELSLKTAEKEFVIPYDMEKLPLQDELLALCDPAEESIPKEWRPANRAIVRHWANFIYEKVRTNSLDKGFRMHLTRIGLNENTQIIALSGEVTAEVGRMIKDALPGKRTMFLGYCSYTDAYIPTARMIPEGGHEGVASMFFHMRPAPFVKEIDDIIRKEVLSLKI